MPYTREGNNSFWDNFKSQFDYAKKTYLDPLAYAASLPKKAVDIIARDYSGLDPNDESLTSEKLISDSLFPKENEEENLGSKLVNAINPYGAAVDQPHIRSAMRGISKIPIAAAMDPMTPALGGGGKLGQTLLGGYFGSQAAESGGSDLGSGLAELDKNQGITPEAIEKLTSGIGQLGFAGAAFHSPVSKGLHGLSEEVPQLGLDKPITGPGTERGSIEFGGRKPKNESQMFDQQDIDKRAMELIDDGHSPKRALQIAKAEFEEMAVEEQVAQPKTTPKPEREIIDLNELEQQTMGKKIPDKRLQNEVNAQKAQEKLQKKLEREIQKEQKSQPEVIDMTEQEQMPVDQNLKQRVAEVKQAEKLQRQLEAQQLKEKKSRENVEPENPNDKNWLDIASDIPKSARGAMDISYPMRQGLFFLNRPEARAGLMQGLKSVKESSHLATKAELANRPNAPLYEQAGLELTKYDPTELHQKSEHIPTTELLEKIPGMKQSQRVFIDQNNLTMANMFDKFASDFQKQGKTFETHPNDYKGAAKYVNVLVGRDTLPVKLQKVSNILNKVFWSPRFVKSRLQLLNPHFYYKLPREIQMAALRDVGGTLGTITTALGAAEYVAKKSGRDDVSVEKDPRHTDFGKLRVGKTTYDFSGGLASPIRLAARLASGETITKKQGKRKLKGASGRTLLNAIIPSVGESQAPPAPFGNSTPGELASFGEGKLAPLVSASKSLWNGTGFGGEKYGPGEFARDTLAPMSPTSFIQNYQRYGLEEALKALPDATGIGTNTDLPEEEIGNYWSDKGPSKKKKKSTTSGKYKFAY